MAFPFPDPGERPPRRPPTPPSPPSRARRVLVPTVLVLGWTLVPLILAAIPSAATQLFGGDAALSSGQALALATATVAAAVTLGVPADRR